MGVEKILQKIAKEYFVSSNGSITDDVIKGVYQEPSLVRKK